MHTGLIMRRSGQQFSNFKFFLIMKKRILFFVLLLGVKMHQAQNPLTADHVVYPWRYEFGYGSNMGYYDPYFKDKELAALLHGTSDGKFPGTGVNTVRPGLFEFFLDFWGYDIRLEYFQYYKKLGLDNQVVILGFPSDRHRDEAVYCDGKRSAVFKNLHEPIWDNGENGTPVNDNNPYALYCWKAANTYRGLIRTYEVWNEPDIDNSGNGWRLPGEPGNWWDNAPAPCETVLNAPIFDYIRMLRITYEVVKAVDPRAYVAVGGLGLPSFLDLICRYTDNPAGGMKSAKHPRTGAAYFDCMDYHVYPHFTDAMRWWNNSIGGFSYARHSDAGVQGVFQLRDRFNTVLQKYGYDGKNKPAKIWICTEYGMPRKQIGDYIGSSEAQCNFTIKSLVTAQKQGLAQMFIYGVADEAKEGQSPSEFAYMGMYKNLRDVELGKQEPNDLAFAHKTTHDLLSAYTYDPIETAKMKLKDDMGGGAFRNKTGEYTYVLWALTHKDMSELASTSYSFPSEYNYELLARYEWNYARTKDVTSVAAEKIPLTGAPIFLRPTTNNRKSSMGASTIQGLSIAPNPMAEGQSQIRFSLVDERSVSVEVYDLHGRKVESLFSASHLPAGVHSLPIDLSAFPSGSYYVRLLTDEQVITRQVIR
jgi:hypothetical protein